MPAFPPKKNLGKNSFIHVTLDIWNQLNIQINFSDLNPIATGVRLLVVAKAVSKKSQGRS